VHQHEKLDYVELPAVNLEATKRFFSQVFQWKFQDFGTQYSAFSNAGIDGGFFSAEYCSKTSSGAALLVFYSDDLEQTQAKIKDAGGSIVQETFSFPGGRRFHFTEPSGNEFAVWSQH